MFLIQNKILVKILSLNFASAIALYPFVFVRFKAYKTDRTLINHERIHLRQQRELLLVFFYLMYLIEFLWNLIKYRSRYVAYLNISLEKEAYAHENDLEYLKKRKIWAFRKYF